MKYVRYANTNSFTNKTVTKTQHHGPITSKFICLNIVSYAGFVCVCVCLCVRACVCVFISKRMIRQFYTVVLLCDPPMLNIFVRDWS